MITSNLCDYHIHTRYSSDSSEEPENIIRHAINEGLAEICFTDHMDLDYPETTEYENPAFIFDTAAYYRELSALRTKYAGDIKIKSVLNSVSSRILRSVTKPLLVLSRLTL